MEDVVGEVFSGVNSCKQQTGALVTKKEFYSDQNAICRRSGQRVALAADLLQSERFADCGRSKRVTAVSFWGHHPDIATYLGGDLLEHGETRRPNPIVVGDQDPHLPLSSQDL
jgi:hypothetical protein